MFQNFIMINKTFTFKLFLSGNKFGFASNIWACLSANITIYNVVTGIISEPQKLQTSGHHGIYAFIKLQNPNLHHYFGLCFRHNLVEIRIPKKFSVSFQDVETDQKFLRNSNLNEISFCRCCIRQGQLHDPLI